jgi:nucleotide-binding universal stress UspA family protein
MLAPNWNLTSNELEDRSRLMTPRAIISYDDTQNDHDALALGRVLGDAGAKLTLAYVRHATQGRPDREQLAHHEAEALLERGSVWLDDPDVERRVVMSPSTSEGLSWLATQVRADVIVFGSDYRTRNGYVAIGRSAQALLENGLTALALAPANYAAAAQREVGTIGVLAGSADEAAIETAFALAGRLGAKVTDGNRGVGLLVVGSRPEARDGRVMITSAAQNAIEEANSPVLVVGRGVPLNFETLVTA